eukprot:jgi/Chlat1/1995/Chrsp158S02287
MPGPGSHLLFGLGTGLALMHASGERFGPYHTLVFGINGFLGPDIGPGTEFFLHDSAPNLGGKLMHYIHNPFYFPLLLGPPLAFGYARASRKLLPSHLALSFQQCACLVAAGCLWHFFLDHLFEENGQTEMYKWVISTGWWESSAEADVTMIAVVGTLTMLLLASFMFINRPSQFQVAKTAMYRKTASMAMMVSVAVLYVLWCAHRMYWTHPRQPAVGEEADLGVLVFLGLYFFLPLWLCLHAMHEKRIVVELADADYKEVEEWV